MYRDDPATGPASKWLGDAPMRDIRWTRLSGEHRIQLFDGRDIAGEGSGESFEEALQAAMNDAFVRSVENDRDLDECDRIDAEERAMRCA